MSWSTTNAHSNFASSGSVWPFHPNPREFNVKNRGVATKAASAACLLLNLAINAVSYRPYLPMHYSEPENLCMDPAIALACVCYPHHLLHVTIFRRFGGQEKAPQGPFRWNHIRLWRFRHAAVCLWIWHWLQQVLWSVAQGCSCVRGGQCRASGAGPLHGVRQSRH